MNQQTKAKFTANVDRFLKELSEHVATAEKHFKEIKEQVKHLDAASAKAALTQLGASGFVELNKLQGQFKKQFGSLSENFNKHSKNLGLETGRLVKKTRKTVKELQSQVKAIADAERGKRRARRRPE